MDEFELEMVRELTVIGVLVPVDFSFCTLLLGVKMVPLLQKYKGS